MGAKTLSTEQRLIEALRDVRRLAGGANTMTNRLLRICEVADAAIEGRAPSRDVRVPPERFARWRDGKEHPPREPGHYVGQSAVFRFIYFAEWDGRQWLDVTPGRYLNIKVPKPKEIE